MRERKMVTNILTLQPAYEKFEMVWAHIRGFPLWPGIIETELPNGKYTIHFFGDYTKSDVTKIKIMHFFEGFRLYSNLNSAGPKLYKTVKETQIFLFEKERAQYCFICKMMEMKKKNREVED